jgi:hypothetical protein
VQTMSGHTASGLADKHEGVGDGWTDKHEGLRDFVFFCFALGSLVNSCVRTGVKYECHHFPLFWNRWKRLRVCLVRKFF